MLKHKVLTELELQNYANAYALVYEAQKTNPNSAELFALLGYIETTLEHDEKAYEYYNRAYECDDSNIDAIAGLLRCSVGLNCCVEKEELLQKIKSCQEENAYLARCAYYYEKHDLKKAYQEMQRAYQLYPASVYVVEVLLDSMIKNGMPKEEILSLIKKAKKLKKYEKIWALEIKYLYKEEMKEECLKACKKCMIQFPNSDIAQLARNITNKIKNPEMYSGSTPEKKQEQYRTAGTEEKSQYKTTQRSENTVEQSMQELNAMIGLDSVKREIERIRRKIEYDKLRREKLGIEEEKKDSYHFVFLGNPGTGKTTVARLLAEIFYSFGLLEKGQLIEVDRGDLVGAFQGHTAQRTKKVIDDAMGGVLFVDEAYALVNGENDDFGKEAIDTLVKAVEDYRDKFIVILAGYKQEMHDLLKANVGLESRFTKVIEFPDYSEDELLEIAKKMAKEQHYRFSEEGEIAFREMISRKKVNKKFGNARAVRNLMNDAFAEKAFNYGNDELSEEYMTILTPKDFGIDMKCSPKERSKKAMEKLDNLIGLNEVKKEIRTTLNVISYMKKEQQQEKKVNTSLPFNMHLCFTGNPGTGKTTVARIYAEVLAGIGVLKTGEILEVSRGDLVGRYSGETAIKTAEVCEKAYGGVLFIDEAYSLVNGEQDSFGLEAVSTLIQEMENNRDKLVVIFAGYSKEMDEFMDSNSGIKSRIGRTIEFEDYNAEELIRIFYNCVEEKKISLTDEAKLVVNSQIEEMYRTRDKRFGNAREMRTLCENSWKNMVNRVEAYELLGEDRKVILPEDISIQ